MLYPCDSSLGNDIHLNGGKPGSMTMLIMQVSGTAAARGGAMIGVFDPVEDVRRAELYDW